MMLPNSSWKKWCGDSRGGFTLIEVLIYAVIFSVSAFFLVNILTSVTQTEVRQNSINSVSQQVTFVANTIQRLVRQSSLIQNTPGSASSTLTLRMSTSTLDQVVIYTDASSTGIYMKEINGSGVSSTIALTDDMVTVGNFSVTKFEVPGGQAVVQVDLTLNYNSGSRNKIARTWRGAISRISAATFDSSLVPNASNSFDLGGSSATWKDGYFSGNVNVTGKLGVGTTPTELGATTAKMKLTGDIGFSTSTGGIILMAPNGTSCYRLGVSNAGVITTSSVTCP
jgi:Tfp pilus assembly protein PilV